MAIRGRSPCDATGVECPGLIWDARNLLVGRAVGTVEISHRGGAFGHRVNAARIPDAASRSNASSKLEFGWAAGRAPQTASVAPSNGTHS